MALLTAQLLQHHPVASIALALAVLLLSRHVYRRIIEERKIQALGGHAAQRTSWIPFGLPFLYDAVKYTMKYEDVKTWHKTFAYAHPANPYTVETRVLGGRVFTTADPENIKAILATQFNDYGKGPVFNEHWHDFLGDSIFTTDGERWHNSRQLIRPQFIKDRVSDLHVFEAHVQKLLPMLESKQPGQAVNASSLFFRYTLDAATDFLLGESVDSLHNPKHRFADAFGEIQRVQSLIARAGPANYFVPRKTFHEGLKVLDDFIQPFIERTLRLSPEELEKKTKTDEGYNFLHALASYTRDRKVLRDQLTAVLLAGRDTTACTLSWMFYELSRQPAIVERLRTEILAQVGSDREPTYDDLKSMRYLQHTINETLRLYPTVPYNVRVALKDTTLPHGGGPDGNSPVGILAGTPIGYSTLVLQRRADIYPAESEKFAHYLTFSPDRWDNWTPKAWTYIPFNGGPRICVGQQFAITEMAYTTVRVLQAYSRIECRMDRVPGEKAEIVLQPSEGVNIVFWR